MAQMLQAPIQGYEDAIVVPPINANNFELKQPLINLVQSNKFTGRQDPHNHLRFFNKVTSTFRTYQKFEHFVKSFAFSFFYRRVKLRDWIEKEPPKNQFFLTWDGLVSTDAPLSNFFAFLPKFFRYATNRRHSIEDKMTIKMNQMMSQMKALVTTPAPVKAVEEGNFHQNSVIESLPMSPILVEDSEPTQEEIDILLVPDNLIPPGVEDADSEDEVNESPNLDHQDDPSFP
ncbi:hypothetical protein Tco_0690400 [Tanacetum coccineum]